MTIARLAKLATVSTATISMIERGKRTSINIATVDRILAAMELRLDVGTVPLWADVDEAAADQGAPGGCAAHRDSGS
jgi:transcriptional regulator with XRE-family HTH domain